MNSRVWKWAAGCFAAGLIAMVMPAATSATTTPAPGNSGTESAEAFWTPDRRAAAQPRDVVVDARGLSYIRNSRGALERYGHGQMPMGKPDRPSKAERVVTNAQWTMLDAPIAMASGRLYFEMPDANGDWGGYVCSGSVVTDAATDASIILTAAHCVFDDVNDVFARVPLFIPDQAATTGTATDLDCTNDPYGCWSPAYGVVDQAWTAAEWPDNVAYDYGYYVVPTFGQHDGSPVGSESLEVVAGSLPMSFGKPTLGGQASTDWGYAFGYSYREDPDLRYCAQGVGANGSVNWWLSKCKLSGGASGGPWMQPFDSSVGAGQVISVNSWGYMGGPGMAGPRFDDSSAACVLSQAETVLSSTPAERGVTAECP